MANFSTNTSYIEKDSHRDANYGDVHSTNSQWKLTTANPERRIHVRNSRGERGTSHMRFGMFGKSVLERSIYRRDGMFE